MIDTKNRQYIFIFIICAVINLLFLSQSQAPVYYPDSYEYIDVARQINNKQWPDFSLRTPTYPLYLALFSAINNIGLIVFFNAVIGAAGATIGLWLLNRISKHRYLNFIFVVMAFSDYGILNYQKTFLVEAIAPALMVFSMAGNLRLATGKSIKARTFLLLSLTDLPLMFLKPYLIIFPLIFKGFLLLSSLIYKKTIIKQNVRYLVLGLFFNTIFLIGLPTYNYFHSGAFQISTTGPVAAFGRALTLGYLEKLPYYEDAPKSVSDLINLNLNHNRLNSPFDVKDLVISEKMSDDPVALFSEANKYIYFKNKRIFVITMLKLIPDTFTVQREFYAKLNYRMSTNGIYFYPDKFYETINNGKLIGFVVCVGIFINWLIRRDAKAIYLGIILIAVFITVSTITIMGYSEFARLRLPVDPLLNLMVFLPILVLRPKSG